MDVVVFDCHLIAWFTNEIQPEVPTHGVVIDQKIITLLEVLYPVAGRKPLRHLIAQTVESRSLTSQDFVHAVEIVAMASAVVVNGVRSDFGAMLILRPFN